MTDVRLYQTDDDGNIEYVAGQATMADGLETAVYLSLFGGNESDTGLEETDHLQWWANLSETEEDKKYRSQTQNLLTSIPSVPANLRRIEDAVGADLAWLVSAGLASAVSAEVTIPALNRVEIAVNVEIDDAEYDYVFTEAWRDRELA